MDPVTLIVTALVTGATAGLKDTATDALKDAYAGLKRLLTRKFAGKPEAETALEQHEQKPDVWEAPMRDAILQSGADQDDEILRAAQGVLQIVHPEQLAEGKYNVQITGPAQGNVFGDHATLNQSFGGPQPGV
jgi:hypothetical protein